MNDDRNQSGAIVSFNFISMLTIAFIVLKLCKVITWKWVWVLAPMWISFCLVAIIFVVVLIVAAFRKEL